MITNDTQLDAEDILRAYKRQPIIEKRFSQLKTDFVVAPVYLKEVSRIEALLCVYFMVLLLQTLMERELRLAIATERSAVATALSGRPRVSPSHSTASDRHHAVAFRVTRIVTNEGETGGSSTRTPSPCNVNL